jgi:hypothetical protein
VLNIGIFNRRDFAIQIIDLASANVVGNHLVMLSQQNGHRQTDIPTTSNCYFQNVLQKIGQAIQYPANKYDYEARILPASIKSYVISFSSK